MMIPAEMMLVVGVVLLCVLAGLIAGRLYRP